MMRPISLNKGDTLVKIIITFLYNFHISPLTNNPSSPSLPAYPNMWDLWHHDTKWQYKYWGSVNDKESINIQHEEQPRHGGRGFLVDCWDVSRPGGKSQVVPINALLSYLKEMTFNLQAGVRVGEVSIFYFQFLLVCHVMSLIVWDCQAFKDVSRNQDLV